jgi:hypothetical protein
MWWNLCSKTYDMTGNQFEVVPRAYKKMLFILEYSIIQYTKMVVDQNVLSKNKPDNGVEAIKGMQTPYHLLAGDRMVRLIETSSMNKATILLMNWLMILRMESF